MKGECWLRMECVNCVVNVARLVGQARPEKPATAFSTERFDMARRVYLTVKDWNYFSSFTLFLITSKVNFLSFYPFRCDFQSWIIRFCLF